jgi:hypothetical protein
MYLEKIGLDLYYKMELGMQLTPCRPDGLLNTPGDRTF